MRRTSLFLTGALMLLSGVVLLSAPVPVGHLPQADGTFKEDVRRISFVRQPVRPRSA
jgi:hypothetical protein